MSQTRFDIQLRYPESMGEQIGLNAEKALVGTELSFRYKRTPPQVWASLAEVTPAAIALYVGGAVFAGFLAEFGKDGYTAFKKLVAGVLNDAVLTYTLRSTYSEATGSGQRVSKAFSATFVLQNERHVTLRFSEGEGANWLTQFHDFSKLMEIHIRDFPEDELTAVTNKVNADLDEEIYVRWEQGEGQWVFRDIGRIVQDHRQKHK